jgi:hypothetical protein
MSRLNRGYEVRADLLLNIAGLETPKVEYVAKGEIVVTKKCVRVAIRRKLFKIFNGCASDLLRLLDFPQFVALLDFVANDSWESGVSWVWRGGIPGAGGLRF